MYCFLGFVFLLATLVALAVLLRQVVVNSHPSIREVITLWREAESIAERLLVFYLLRTWLLKRTYITCLASIALGGFAAWAAICSPIWPSIRQIFLDMAEWMMPSGG